MHAAPVLHRVEIAETRRWTRHRRVAGTVEVIIGVAAFVLAAELHSRTQQLQIENLLIALVGILEISLGVAFAFGRRWPRPLLWVLSAIHLLAFPVGTVLAGYILWVLFETRHELGHLPPSERAA